MHKDILIIGSGYGGAVAALRLTEKGKKVCMLEMGIDWRKEKEPFSPMTNPGKSAAWLKNRTIAPFMNVFPLKKFTGALDRWDFEHVKVWMGRGVGGGSLVNGGMAVLPKREYFEEIFPTLDSEKFYKHYFPLVEKELKVNSISDAFLENCDYYKFSRVGEREAENAGFKNMRVPNVYDFDYMEKEYNKEVPQSALAGEVIYGNNHGKNSLDKTYIKKAEETGNLEILELHKVESITQKEDGTYSLLIHRINTKGEIEEEIIMTTSKLILAAGTMGTLKLLLKSATENGLKVDKNVGKYWGNNGNLMTGRNFVNAFNGGTGMRHSTIPIGGVDNWEAKDHAFFAEIAPLPMGLNVATTLYLMINKLKKHGVVTYNEENNKLEIDWNEEHTEHMLDNAKYFIKKMNKVNGGTRSHLLFHNGYGPDVCYHPLGGVPLGKATDAYGRLNGHKNLYVLDGSLVPGTIGVNPFLTITAITEYCMYHIIAEDFNG